MAADRDHVDIVEYLVDHGADINIKDESEVSTLGWSELKIVTKWLRYGIQFPHNCNVRVMWHHAVRLYHSQIPKNELFIQSPVLRTTKHGLYVSFSGCALQLQVTFALSTADHVWENVSWLSTKWSEVPWWIAYHYRTPVFMSFDSMRVLLVLLDIFYV